MFAEPVGLDFLLVRSFMRFYILKLKIIVSIISKTQVPFYLRLSVY